MDTSEKWNRIVGLVEKYKSAREEAIQSIWETFVFGEIFEYETTEIESQRSIKIGSTERIIPDIIIKDESKDLFIVELKQHTLNTGKEQLLSYFKQLKLNIGILVNSRISIFVYDYEKNDSEQKYIEIDFVKDNSDGIKFVELFSKGNFNEEKVVDFVNSKYESKANTQKIKQELKSDNFVRTLVFNYFKEKYSEEEIEAVLKDYEIKAMSKKNFVSEKPKITFSTIHRSSNSSRKTQFLNWMLTNGKSANTSNSYSYYIDKLSQHYSSETGENINIYALDDFDFIKNLMIAYSTSGKYAEFGYKGNGTARCSIAEYVRFFESEILQ